MRYNLFVLLSDKSKAVQQIAEFLELEDFNLDSVVSNSSIDATRDRRQKFYERKMSLRIIEVNQFLFGFSDVDDMVMLAT